MTRSTSANAPRSSTESDPAVFDVNVGSISSSIAMFILDDPRAGRAPLTSSESLPARQRATTAARAIDRGRLAVASDHGSRMPSIEAAAVASDHGSRMPSIEDAR
jgi:hypothetical protein